MGTVKLEEIETQYLSKQSEVGNFLKKYNIRV